MILELAALPSPGPLVPAPQCTNAASSPLVLAPATPATLRGEHAAKHAHRRMRLTVGLFPSRPARSFLLTAVSARTSECCQALTPAQRLRLPVSGALAASSSHGPASWHALTPAQPLRLPVAVALTAFPPRGPVEWQALRSKYSQALIPTATRPTSTLPPNHGPGYQFNPGSPHDAMSGQEVTGDETQRRHENDASENGNDRSIGIVSDKGDEESIGPVSDKEIEGSIGPSGEGLRFRVLKEEGGARLGLVELPRPRGTTPEQGPADSTQAQAFSSQEQAGSTQAQAGTPVGSLLPDSDVLRIETPMVVPYTRRGLLLHLMPDVMRPLDVPALQLSTLHFLESPLTEVISQFPGGIRGYTSVGDKVFVAVCRDLLLPSVDSAAGNSTDTGGPSFDTPAGRRQVNSQRHMALVGALRPDLWVPICDAPSSAASLKRHHRAVDRTLRWLDECLSLANPGQPGQPAQPGQPGQAEQAGKGGPGGVRSKGDPGATAFAPQRGARSRAKKAEAAAGAPCEPRPRSTSGAPHGISAVGTTTLGDQGGAGVPLRQAEQGNARAPSGVAEGGHSRGVPLGGAGGAHTCVGGAPLAAVVGGGYKEQRRRSAELSAQREGVAGFHLAGFGTGETFQDRGELLAAAIEPLPRDKLRHMSITGYPEEILQAVEAGVDLIDTVYPDELALEGCAMVFPVSPPSPGAPTAEGALKLNLRDLCHRKSWEPLLQGCGCYSCQRHTRAYIHHLLDAHEMLGHVLLAIHNTHHYNLFMAAVRHAIQGSSFPEFKEWFLTMRRQAT